MLIPLLRSLADRIVRCAITAYRPDETELAVIGVGDAAAILDGGPRS